MKYTVLRGFGSNFEAATQELDRAVAVFIDYGYKPQGGVSAMVTIKPDGYKYCDVMQAMVKED